MAEEEQHEPVSKPWDEQRHIAAMNTTYRVILESPRRLLVQDCSLKAYEHAKSIPVALGRWTGADEIERLPWIPYSLLCKESGRLKRALRKIKERGYPVYAITIMPAMVVLDDSDDEVEDVPCTEMNVVNEISLESWSWKHITVFLGLCLTENWQPPESAPAALLEYYLAAKELEAQRWAQRLVAMLHQATMSIPKAMISRVAV